MKGLRQSHRSRSRVEVVVVFSLTVEIWVLTNSGFRIRRREGEIYLVVSSCFGLRFQFGGQCVLLISIVDRRCTSRSSSFSELGDGF
jgi:hypothetical protein